MIRHHFSSDLFPIKEEEKIMVDRDMRKGYLLGILRKGLSSYSYL